MIEVASHPKDLAAWDQAEHPFYLELYGETEPLLDMTYSEVVPPAGDAVTTTTSTPIYEYWWTIGHAGHGPEHHHLWPGRPADHSLWNDLSDPAARVYVYFPIHAGWRIKELVATVKYLGPVHDEKNWATAAAKEWEQLQPVLEGAGNVAAKLGPIPGVGTVAVGAAPILSTLAKLKIGSVPQGVKGFDWSVGKVTFGSKERHGVMQGVMWTLPKAMFELLGGRLTGSLAVSFIPSRSQSATQGDATSAWTPQPARVLAHAVVYADEGTRWVPNSSDFVELLLTPRVPSGPAGE
jgi:hypothetical protein